MRIVRLVAGYTVIATAFACLGAQVSSSILASKTSKTASHVNVAVLNGGRVDLTTEEGGDFFPIFVRDSNGCIWTVEGTADLTSHRMMGKVTSKVCEVQLGVQGDIWGPDGNPGLPMTCLETVKRLNLVDRCKTAVLSADGQTILVVKNEDPRKRWRSFLFG